MNGAKQHPEILAEFRLDSAYHKYLGFAWTYAYLGHNSWNTDDVTVKHAGYVVTCLMMEVFDYPAPKIMIAMQTGIMEAHSVEQRFLIRQAMDVLEPMLPNLPPDPVVPDWVEVVRQAIANDNHSQTQHAWSVIIRHPDVYFPYRSVLVPWIVQSITRVSQQTTAQADNRKLAIDVCNMLIKWELKAKTTPATPNAAGTVPPAFEMTTRQQESIFSFLMFTACSIADTSVTIGETLAVKCVEQLRSVIVEKLWPRAQFSFARLDKVFGHCPPTPPQDHQMGMSA